MRIIKEVSPLMGNLNGNTGIMSYYFDIAKYHPRWPELDKLSWQLADNVNKDKNMGLFLFLKGGSHSTRSGTYTDYRGKGINR